jgi:hypothetical protein
MWNLDWTTLAWIRTTVAMATFAFGNGWIFPNPRREVTPIPFKPLWRFGIPTLTFIALGANNAGHYAWKLGVTSESQNNESDLGGFASKFQEGGQLTKQ